MNKKRYLTVALSLSMVASSLLPSAITGNKVYAEEISVLVDAENGKEKEVKNEYKEVAVVENNDENINFNEWTKEDFHYYSDGVIDGFSDRGIKKLGKNDILIFPDGTKEIIGNYSIRNKEDENRFLREFGRRKHWSKVIIPDSVTDLGYAVFYTAKIDEVQFSNNLKSIGELAFFDCFLPNINLPKGLNIIDDNAFERNRIQSIEIPSSVTKINKYAFSRNNLNTVKISENTEVEKGAFINQVSEYRPSANPFTTDKIGYNGKINFTDLGDKIKFENGEYSFINDEIEEANLNFDVEEISFKGTMKIVNSHKWSKGTQTDLTMNDIKDMEDNLKNITNKSSELEKKIADLEKEISSLTKENKDLKEKFDKCKEKREELLKEIERLKQEIKEKTGNIADQKSDIADLNKKILELEKRITDIEREIKNLKDDNKKLDEKIKEKELVIKDKKKEEKDKKKEEDKKNECVNNKDKRIKELEDRIKVLEKDSSTCRKDDNEKIDIILKEIEKLNEEVKTLREEKELLRQGLPDGIEVGQWYPEDVKSYPNKRSYKHGENIDLNGMVVRFTRIVKKGNSYTKEYENVEYKTFKNGYRGWSFRLKTPKALYTEENKGKMKIKFSFVLSNKEKSMR